MMDFARRLAPVRETDPSRAAPVLPSRFAGESPLRADVAAQERPDDQTAASASVDPQMTPATMAPRPASSTQAPSAPLPAAAPAVRTALPGDEPQRVSQRDASPPPSRQPRTAIPADPAPDPAPRRAPLDIASRGPAPSAAEAMAPAVAAEPVRPAAAARPAAPLRDTHVASTASQPMSHAALAARSAPAADLRPVVHVTIDRIEVRAPAASPRPAAVSRRAATPSVSLADYLRAGGSKGGGAS